VQDCQWIAQLLQHGLQKGSFLPTRWQRQRRDLTWKRAQVVGEHSRISNRIQKILEDANVKFASVASDGVGVSGRRMLEAMIVGRSDAKQLADLVPRQLRSQIPQLEEGLYGRISEYHRWMLRLLRDQLLASEQFLARLDERIAELTCLSSPSWRNWMRFPIDRRVTEVLVAEVGPDMSPFPATRN
jgi:transposase